jgi:hypothetical protein
MNRRDGCKLSLLFAALLPHTQHNFYEPSSALLSPPTLPSPPDSALTTTYNTTNCPTAITALLTHAHPTCGYHSVPAHHQLPPLGFVGSLSLNGHRTAKARETTPCNANARKLSASEEEKEEDLVLDVLPLLL